MSKSCAPLGRVERRDGGMGAEVEFFHSLRSQFDDFLRPGSDAASGARAIRRVWGRRVL